MKRIVCVAMLLAALCAAAPPALAVFVFRAGDTVYVDGKRYSWEEWKKIRDNTPPQQAAPATPADIASTTPPASFVAAQAPRAASCISSIYYDEFPSEDERFQCTSGLGALTREEILRRGWRVDLIEKIPTPADKPSHSPRGLPLYQYKLVISR